MKSDWQEVADLNPRGYAEFQDGTTEVLHGPVESVTIDDNDMVHIKLKWAAKMGVPGSPTFMKWRNSSQDTEITFPNLMVSFEFQNTSKGRRIRFGLNILYINEVKGVDPSKVEGLVIG